MSVTVLGTMIFFAYVHVEESDYDVFVINGKPYKDYADIWFYVTDKRYDVWVDGSITGYLSQEQFRVLSDINDMVEQGYSVSLALTLSGAEHRLELDKEV